MSEFRFHSIYGEQMDRISPNFVYAFILTISRLELLRVIFGLFVRVTALDWCQNFVGWTIFGQYKNPALKL